ncbi:MAG TPA: hypothetical protein VFC99_19115 [Acidimicrobiia bacterium]|nr:hypothetical protein [Acidimicrobiia bacterium]
MRPHRLAVAGAVALLAAALAPAFAGAEAAPPPPAAPGVKALAATPLDASVVVNGYEWQMSNACGTSNGLPTGGTSNGSPGLGILEAKGPGGGDAFDCGAVVWVGNTVVADDDGTVDVSPSGGDTVVTPSTQTIGGLHVTDTYRVFSGGDTARVLVTLENPTAADISTTVAYASNFGSDTTTTIAGTSSGDTGFTTADRWLVTADDPTAGGDIVNTSVFFGPGAVDVTPSSVSTAVFASAGTQGAMATFDVTVPAGATRSLLFFQVVTGGGNGTPNSAVVASAAVWDTPLAASSPLLAGISPADQGLVVNWTRVVAPPTTTTTTAAPAAAVGVTPTFTG